MKVKKKKIFEIDGYFGWWGMHQTIWLEGTSYKEVTTNLKQKVMELLSKRGKGHNQKNFSCKVTGYRIIEEIKPHIEFKKPKVFK
jgi:hypothetical protein